MFFCATKSIISFHFSSLHHNETVHVTKHKYSYTLSLRYRRATHVVVCLGWLELQNHISLYFSIIFNHHGVHTISLTNLHNTQPYSTVSASQKEVMVCFESNSRS